MQEVKRTLYRLRLKFRRNVRKQKRQVEDMTAQADDSVNRLVFRRFENLYKVRRFVGAWILLVFFIGFGSIWQVRGLDKYYLTLVPTSGGIYREGIVGTFTNASPLFGGTNVDASVSRLVFSGLFEIAPDGTLQPDLATGYEVDNTGQQYTVGIRSDVMWHDGESLTAEDVVFTYNSIKNSDVNSPLISSWRDVSIVARDDYTVVFTLPDTLGSFKYSLINGIVPQHVLGGVDPGDLRTSTFNTVNPVGTGPFTYTTVEVSGVDPDNRREKITLEANEAYFKGSPKIDGMVVRTYPDEESILSDFDRQLITSMVGLNTLPDNLENIDSVQTYSTPLRSAVMGFFNTSGPVLGELDVRRALVLGADTSALRSRVDYPLLEVDGPFLKSHFAYNETYAQPERDLVTAQLLLDEAGWTLKEDGFRYKGDRQLTLRVVSQSLSEYLTIAQGLQEQWRELGVNIEERLRPEDDIQSEAIVGHDYDILLYGVAIGPDPDVFAYWHSSQADPRLRARLNLSEYSSDVADDALEAGRTRVDEDIRTVKYEPFLEQWRLDAPALALYQPRFLFVTRGEVEGYDTGQFNSPTDRFYSVENWQVRREKTVK